MSNSNGTIVGHESPQEARRQSVAGATGTRAVDAAATVEDLTGRDAAEWDCLSLPK